MADWSFFYSLKHCFLYVELQNHRSFFLNDFLLKSYSNCDLKSRLE